MAVSKRVAMVLKGFADLTAAERSIFVEKANDFQSNDAEKKSVLTEEIRKSMSLSVTLGPSPQSCPCCGR